MPGRFIQRVEEGLASGQRATLHSALRASASPPSGVVTKRNS